ncbi:MAG: CapA family protein [Eubacteriales bacterium]|nr:CapA family protein [Eubacteriales bacterium]
MSLKILIGADVVPTVSNLEAFQTSAPHLLKDGLNEVWNAADLRLFNLETPLADRESPANKCGPRLLAPVKCAEGIRSLNPTGVCLCNNHILDHGAEGLFSTQAALKEKGIPTFGAGEDIDEADKPFLYTRHGVRIGVYTVCEHEFSCATDRKAGANPLDLVNLGDRIRELKSNCDRLIVLYHGGREHYAYPSPDLQKTCRKIVECGASLVICQHSHCVGSAEKWNGATIVYGQGNFIFDAEDGDEGFDTGLLVRYTIGDYGADSVDYVPIVRVRGGAALANEEQARKILDGFTRRSLHIRVEGFVSARYSVYAAEQKEKLVKVFLSGNTILRAVNVLHGRRPTRVYDRQSKTDILNSLRCESIRELMIEGLNGDVGAQSRGARA